MKKLLAILSVSIFACVFAGVASAATFTVGNDAVSRPVVDAYTNFTIIDTNNPSAFLGELNTFDYFAANTRPFRFVLVNGSNLVQWVSDEITPAGVGVQTWTPSSPVVINAGWNVGLYFAQAGTVPFEYNGAADPAWYESNNAGLPIVGETLAYAGSSDRYYSFVATGVTYPYGEIIEPAVNEPVTGLIDLIALYKDGDAIKDDVVNWAVRHESCDANTNTKFGNVDSHADAYTWDGMNFSAQIDTSTVTPGYYCFVFNPTDDGSVDVRKTRWFYIDSSDSDNDGVLDGIDLCEGTVSDVLTDSLGTNRWMYDAEGDGWITAVSNGKGFGPKDTYTITIADTYGCSCDQILEEMEEATGLDFEGHHKFGCSKSILEDWIAGVYYVGPTFVETVEIPANDADGVSSFATLETGKDYFLKAYGMGMACDQPGCQITFDAEYSTSDEGSNWVDGVAAPYAGYGPDLLDLKIDGAFVDWGAYNDAHVYQIPYAGTGNVLLPVVYDLTGSYFNDTGILFVDIIEDKWVDLW